LPNGLPQDFSRDQRVAGDFNHWGLAADAKGGKQNFPLVLVHLWLLMTATTATSATAAMM